MKFFFRKLIIFVIIFSWIFSGWPQIQEANAINKTVNWNFNGNSTGWTATNGTANGASTGAPACGTTADNTTNNMATFAYNGALSSQTAFEATSGAVKNTDYRGNINQTVVAPSSGSVGVKGKFSYYGNSTAWGAGKVALELWDSANTTFVASLGCATMSANTAWTTASFGSVVSVTGGTTYTIRVNLVVKTKSNSNTAVTLGVDNVVVNFASTGLAASAPGNTTNAQLDWTASTAGSGANGLHATTPYKVYRGTSSGAESFLVNTTTNSYLDSGTTGNTTYYYYVTDVDTASDESPSSTEVNILTRPNTSTVPTFTDVQNSSLTVSWTAPAGGSPNYTVYRALDSAGSPGTWGAIGATSGPPYLDSGLSASVKYWYGVGGYNATGEGASSTFSNTTTLAASTVSCSTAGSPSSFGALSTGSISTSSPNVTTTFSCTYAGGCTLSVKDGGNGTNPGLTTTPTYIIGSADSNFADTATLVAGITEGYGIQAVTTTAGSGGIVLVYTRYKQIGDAVGGLELTNQGLASSSVAITDREVAVTHKAAISGLTQAGSYQDVITYSCVGN